MSRAVNLTVVVFQFLYLLPMPPLHPLHVPLEAGQHGGRVLQVLQRVFQQHAEVFRQLMSENVIEYEMISLIVYFNPFPKEVGSLLSNCATVRI